MQKSELLLKYDKAVPRYTSYPTVPHWKGISQDDWEKSVKLCLNENSGEDFGISLYVHVPYCRSLCSFCGCTKVISRDPSKGDPFVNAILRELDLKLQAYSRFDRQLSLSEVHFGGGSPTWLSAELLEKLILGILKRFPTKASTPDISIEVDPRTFTPEQAKIMQQCGVRRVSLGVQDFNESTLKAIKRNQSYELVTEAVNLLRGHGITSINFDLVYGLPYQSPLTMKDTIEKVVNLKPSRIALYSYAHLPEIKAQQQGVEKHGLPNPIEKRKLYETAREELCLSEYAEIGMDHFALKSDDLYLALKKQELHRNFMGYTVQNTKLLLGLGPSSLSDSWYAFSQNEKNVEKWLTQIEAGIIIPQGGHLLSSEDLIRRKIILSLMCHYIVELGEIDWKPLSKTDIATDNLVNWNSQNKELTVTELGRPFIRNICSEFDNYFKGDKEKKATYSKSI